MHSSLRLKFYFVQALTLVRAPLIFVFLAISVSFGHRLSEFWFCAAFAAMLLSAITDLFDGYFARKFGVTSQLGSYADPLTDKILSDYLSDPGLSGQPGWATWPHPLSAGPRDSVSAAGPMGILPALNRRPA